MKQSEIPVQDHFPSLLSETIDQQVSQGFDFVGQLLQLFCFFFFFFFFFFCHRLFLIVSSVGVLGKAADRDCGSYR